MDRGKCARCGQRQVLGREADSGTFFCAGCWDACDSDDEQPPVDESAAGAEAQQTHVLDDPPELLADVPQGKLSADHVSVPGVPSITVIADPESNYVRGVAQRLWQAARRMIAHFADPATFAAAAAAVAAAEEDGNQARLELPPSERQTHLKGRTVLELGAGTGAVGVALAKMGATVCVTDLSWVVPLMRWNVQANFADDDPAAPAVRPLAWGNTAQLSQLPHAVYDTIIGSDITYYYSDFPKLFATLSNLCQRAVAAGQPVPQIVLSQTEREDNVTVFRQACADRGWGYSVAGPPVLTRAETLRSALAFVIRLTPPQLTGDGTASGPPSRSLSPPTCSASRFSPYSPPPPASVAVGDGPS
eukprot:TRINITY_DN15844_c0_g1_i2.p1 TRINITY_DN15844_c0_g1~~TRINITY_DN15844_c0_g1_i2.p1  ORF type:complete len:361 (+),score=103.20 TRINITY_DN15844_c0_g1_i2:67-1149(+)